MTGPIRNGGAGEFATGILTDRINDPEWRHGGSPGVVVVDASEAAMVRKRTPASEPVGPRFRTHMSLGTKLGLMTCLCMVMAMLLAASFFNHLSNRAADAKAQSLAGELSDNLASRVKAGFDASFEVVTTTNEALTALWTHGVRSRSIGDILLRQMLEADSDRFGAWTAWKPDAFDGHDDGFVDAPGSDKTGRYLTYWHQNGMEIAHDHVTGYADRSLALYQVPLDTNTAYLSEPYFIDSHDRRIATVSYAEPIFADAVLGAIGIDVTLAPLFDVFTSLPLPPGGRVTLVSHNGVVAMANDANVREKPLLDGRPDLAEDWARIARGEGTIGVGMTSAAGVVRTWHELAFNTVKTPWYVLTEIPLRTFAADARREQAASVVATVVVLLVMMVAILFALRQLVTEPLRIIGAFINGLSDRDGPSECPQSRRSDEIGAIAKALTDLRASQGEVDRLRGAQSEREARFAAARHVELQQLADHLGQTIQAVAHVVDATALKIMRRSETMAATAVASADKTTVIAAASLDADSNVGTVEVAATALRESIVRIVAEMATAKQIASAASEKAKLSSAVTGELSKRAAHIDEVVALITSIAGRTNMLALNATIEAARAGDAGRGFAVVAQEVKGLAVQTTAATSEVALQIKAMQAIAAEAAAALTSISGTVSEIDAISTSISRAVELQGDETLRIGQSVSAAVAASRRVRAAIEDVNRGATGTGEIAAEMLIESSRLADESERLNDEVLRVIERVRAA